MPDPQLITNPADIKLKRDDDVQQIFGRPPRHFLRWGITVLFFFFLTLIGMAFFIEYPDTVVAPVQITTENPPVAVVSRVGGKISKLVVENGVIVVEGELLAELENTAEQSDILTVEALVDKAFSEENQYEFVNFNFDSNYKLGTLQTSYAAFLQDFQDLQFYLENRHLGKRRSALRKQIRQLEKLNDALGKQEQTQRAIVQLMNEKLLRREGLTVDGLESKDNSETAKEQKLRAQRELESIDNQRITNELRITEIKTQILNLRQDDDLNSNEKWQQIKADLQQLQRELKEWKQSYLLFAPIAGKVSLPKTLTVKQFVNTNEELMTIVPIGGAGELVAQALLPISNSGKVAELDSVNIRLNGFPYQEFGVIRGSVVEIAAVPNEDGEGYLVEIDLPNELLTTYDRTLNFRQQMQGEAHIITKKRRIAERIFDPILSALYNRP
ncbi:MAG: HlyD family secretion protein [Saprospiraceae bacterium]